MKKSLPLLITLFALSTLYRSDTVYSATNPEEQSLRISRGLKAYSDQDWLAIAGERTSEKYEIIKGDTLWGISARLFGNSKVWPKIWEINNTGILNPHMIEPRWNLIFNSGSGLTLPSIALKSSGVSTVTNHYVIDKDDHPGAVWDEKTPMPGGEWKKLARQSWENVQADLPPNIDKDGFDTRNRVYLRKPATGLMLPHYVACQKIEPSGTVEGTRSLTQYVYRGSEITIRPGKIPLETNAVYSMLDAEPVELKHDGRVALSYESVGKVKILGLQNGTYIGEIISAIGPVERGSILVPEIQRVEKSGPVAGAGNVKGTILADRRTSAFMSGQNKWVYVDRGLKDGVDKGMIFRIFQNQDPKTGKQLTRGDVFVQGDVQIIQGCDNFSLGMFVWSRGEVPDAYEGHLLTDVADEKVRFYFNGDASDIPITEAPALEQPKGIVDVPPEAAPTKEATVGPGINSDVLTPAPPEKLPGEGDDWLDKLDNHQELKTEEENELHELEKYKDGQNQATQGASPGAPPAVDSTLPPAPSEALPPAPTATDSAQAAPEAPLFDPTTDPTKEASTADIPPPPDSEFPSEEPIVQTPVPMKPAPTKSASGPKTKKNPSVSPTANPFDSGSTDELPPL